MGELLLSGNLKIKNFINALFNQFFIVNYDPFPNILHNPFFKAIDQSNSIDQKITAECLQCKENIKGWKNATSNCGVKKP